MIPKQIIHAAITATLVAAASGKIPEFIKTIRVAQYRLLKESQASNWGQAIMLPVRK